LLVVVAIVAVLSGILLPAVVAARESGDKALCQSNLRQIGFAFVAYCMDWDGKLPANGDPRLWMGRHWRWLLQPYIGFSGETILGDPRRSRGYCAGILVCPSDPTAPVTWDSTSYGYAACFYYPPAIVNAMTVGDLLAAEPWCNAYISAQSLDEVAFPCQKVLVAEWLDNHEAGQNGWWSWHGARNCLFADGHVKYLRAQHIRPAVDGWPDFNLTREGIKGKDFW
jgi:prepilin-type processing-associated H-X9-DG protein